MSTPKYSELYYGEFQDYFKTQKPYNPLPTPADSQAGELVHTFTAAGEHKMKTQKSLIFK